MPQIGRARISLLLMLALIFLRVIIGVHFVREGEKKMHGDYWTAGGFFGAATGPLAPFFHSLVNDFDGKKRLCFDASAEGLDRINLQPTFDRWETYAEEVGVHYGFGDARWEQQMQAEREANRKILDPLLAKVEAGETLSESETKQFVASRQKEHDLRLEIEALRQQNLAAGKILDTAKESFEYFFLVNGEDINNYFNGWEKRLDGFARDGAAKSQVVYEVESLTYQQDEIYGDLVKARGPWLAEVDAAWTSLEQQLNDLALPRQQAADRPTDGVEVRLAKPNEKTWMLSMIDTTVPYFDMTIGVLLIVGLGTRFIGVIAAGFLSLIVMTQLPGVPGAQDSIAQIIEMGALLVLAAIGAGQFGGLDYFIRYFSRSRTTSQ